MQHVKMLNFTSHSFFGRRVYLHGRILLCTLGFYSHLTRCYFLERLRGLDKIHIRPNAQPLLQRPRIRMVRDHHQPLRVLLLSGGRPVGRESPAVQTRRWISGERRCAG